MVKSFALPTSKWYFCVPVEPRGKLGNNSHLVIMDVAGKSVKLPFFNVS